MSTIIQSSVFMLVSLIFSLVLVPVLKTLAMRIGLVDKPNARKVHQEAVPLVGGISIVITTVLALALSRMFMDKFQQNAIWLAGAFLMLITGALDDRLNIRPIYRLVIQIASAYAVASSGVRIQSLYGLFGIEEISLPVQYILTIIVIAGVVNAYNLMDGIDGLLGGLTLVGASVLGIISYQLHQYDLTMLYAAITGSIIGFLRYNLSAKKIFMGDAGSLLLGFILVVTAIKLLNATNKQNPTEQLKVLLLVAGIFLVPVVDSLRVYRARIKKGESPFKADKTHLHHLFLLMGITHRRATFLIIVLVLLIISVLAGLFYLIPVIWVIVVGIAVFVAVVTLLSLNRSVHEWKMKIRSMERS